jgi:hypothetical protein
MPKYAFAQYQFAQTQLRNNERVRPTFSPEHLNASV